jgi:hypothetical protein
MSFQREQYESEAIDPEAPLLTRVRISEIARNISSTRNDRDTAYVMIGLKDGNRPIKFPDRIKLLSIGGN